MRKVLPAADINNNLNYDSERTSSDTSNVNCNTEQAHLLLSTHNKHGRFIISALPVSAV